MPLVLPALISNTSKSSHPFVLFESSVTQSCIAVLKAILDHHDSENRALVFCLLYPPSSLVNNVARLQNERLHIVDRTAHIPGFFNNVNDPGDFILDTVRAAPAGPLTVVIDSADTLCADLGSESKCYSVIYSLLSLIRTRPSPARLVVHLTSPTDLLPLLLSTRLSPSLAHITAHPPTLLTHLASAHLTLPPPSTPPERFWRVFSPLVARPWEVERLIYGNDGPGSGGSWPEAVLEILTRGSGSGTGEGKRRNAERTLEGWSRTKGPCELTELESLRSIWNRQMPREEPIIDPTKNLSFNLNLTPDQQHSRSKVPLPYAHDVNTSNLLPQKSPGAIFYDPDSADDIDDDDPDEDLDI